MEIDQGNLFFAFPFPHGCVARKSLTRFLGRPYSSDRLRKLPSLRSPITSLMWLGVQQFEVLILHSLLLE
ncbi:hypothetical protein RISK_002751 [Rhodopirellula islandica]|uniref:Uncharacterized protein n=1 Tax=Rhodopirellula islandica TaxID=595434 RepID=A0A0J1BFD1_RHOIS|nr:hypothetical protein RISK_002751 [Rhodopirellula islandica]